MREVCPSFILYLESCGKRVSRSMSHSRHLLLQTSQQPSPDELDPFLYIHLSWNYRCTKCGSLFTPEGVPGGREPKYGHGLATWCIYNNVVCGQNLLGVRQALIDIFDLDVPQPTIFRFKSSQREILQPVYDNILTHLLKGSLLHIDETEVKLKGHVGYVWVFASMDAVYFEYRDSRKGSIPWASSQGL